MEPRLCLPSSSLAWPAGACVALPNATVDVWHCDALGVYSDASDPAATRG